ncbi:MAG: tetraacyldisaccharide 4'-kinase [Candidatus Acidiferrales bacterium]
MTRQESLLSPLLWPLSLVYAAAALLRARAYRRGILQSRHLDGVVISVGNLTAGGTGKTPMVLWIAERLISEVKKVGILTRGYRGQHTAASPTDAASPPAAVSASDEVRLLQHRLANRASLGVGANRYERGRELEKLGVDWFVLDDGFQHLQLARDVDIVLIDATDPFSGGRLLPAGHLREPRSALARADIIVITRASHAPAVESAARRDSTAPIFYARPRLDAVYSFSEGGRGNAVPSDALRKLFAFCGIGNPAAFVADLHGWGLPVVGHKFFPDHHRYTEADDIEILRLAKEAGADGLICTEKDLYNLRGIHRGKTPAFYCSISLQIDRADEFWRAVLSIVESRVAARTPVARQG